MIAQYQPTEYDKLELLATEYVQRRLNLTDSYESWRLYAFGCASFGEQGRNAFHAFSSTSSKYNKAEADRQFNACLRTYDGPPVNLAYLLSLIPRAQLDFAQCEREKWSYRDPPQTYKQTAPKIQKIGKYEFIV